MLERETEGAKAKASQSIWPIHSWNGDVHARVCVCVCVCMRILAPVFGTQHGAVHTVGLN